MALRPIITFITDFGLADSYAAVMKAAVLRHCADARLIDVTHQTPGHDVLCASITLERAVDGFPDGTFHLAVVDPGVGSDRRLLIARTKRQTIVCPDNGLITWSAHRHGLEKCWEITWRPEKFSSVFHGRDIMAPIVGQLAAGGPPESLARPIDDPVMLSAVPTTFDATPVTVIQIDHFGNATTNLLADRIAALEQKSVRVHGKSIGKLRKTYSDVAPGKPLALIGSSGLLEIAVRDGSAAKQLKLKVGDRVTLK